MLAGFPEWNSAVLFLLRGELDVKINGMKGAHCSFMNFGHRAINMSIPHSLRDGSGLQCSAFKVPNIEIGHYA